MFITPLHEDFSLFLDFALLLWVLKLREKSEILAPKNPFLIVIIKVPLKVTLEVSMFFNEGTKIVEVLIQ